MNANAVLDLRVRIVKKLMLVHQVHAQIMAFVWIYPKVTMVTLINAFVPMVSLYKPTINLFQYPIFVLKWHIINARNLLNLFTHLLLLCLSFIHSPHKALCIHLDYFSYLFLIKWCLCDRSLMKIRRKLFLLAFSFEIFLQMVRRIIL